MIEGMSDRLLRRTVISLGVAAAVGTRSDRCQPERRSRWGCPPQRPTTIRPPLRGPEAQRVDQLASRRRTSSSGYVPRISLGDMGADARRAVPDLIESLSEADSFIRSAAAYSLGQIGPDAAGAIPAMVKAFKRSSGFDKGIIGPAIARIGPAAKVAIPALEKALDDPETWNRIEVAAALWHVAHAERAVAALSAEAQDWGPRQRIRRARPGRDRP